MVVIHHSYLFIRKGNDQRLYVTVRKILDSGLKILESRLTYPLRTA